MILFKHFISYGLLKLDHKSLYIILYIIYLYIKVPGSQNSVLVKQKLVPHTESSRQSRSRLIFVALTDITGLCGHVTTLFRGPPECDDSSEVRGAWSNMQPYRVNGGSMACMSFKSTVP